jgi:hypothetical protein
MRVLAQLGVRIENVWAVEADTKVHDAAMQRARDAFPALKIYRGNFNSFTRVVRERFDVVYLDFTAPMFSSDARPYATIHTLFDEQVLAELSVLVVNVAEPPKSSDVEELLASYFAHQPLIESAALGYRDDQNPDSIWYAETAPDQWPSHSALVSAVGSHLHEFYSAFCTQYPSIYANRVQPALRLLRVADARTSLYVNDPKVYETAFDAASDTNAVRAMLTGGELPKRPDGFGPGMDLILSASEFPLWWFIEGLREKKQGNKIAQKWVSEYQEKLSPLDSNSYRPTRIDAVRLSDLLWLIAEGYFPLASKALLTAMVRALDAFAGNKEGLFCDIPMLHLISQLALNQIGFPYHPVQEQHWRATYKAKQTRMFLDIHVFDQCRPIYDRLPSVTLYPDHFCDLNEQFITRIGISLIEAQARGLVPKLYWASSLEARYGSEWERWATPPNRADLNVADQ